MAPLDRWQDWLWISWASSSWWGCPVPAEWLAEFYSQDELAHPAPAIRPASAGDRPDQQPARRARRLWRAPRATRI
jgi:hypothetical protein